MISYDDQLVRLNSVKKTFSWDEMQPLHKNENCENLREREAARKKQKRINADLEEENDNTKCVVIKKILDLTDAINWRDSIRDYRQVNVNSVSLISFLKIRAVKDPEARKRIEDLIVAALAHNVHPFSLEPLGYPGITEDIVEDVVQFCTKGDVVPKPACRVNLRPNENRLIQDALIKYQAPSAQEKKMCDRIIGKLANRRRYKWMGGMV
jgi:hypothetical protein